MPAPTPSSFDVYPWLSTATRPAGTMDGPDLQTRAAALKLQAGIAPTPKEMMRLAGRQALEAGTGNGSYAPSDPRSFMAPNPALGAGPTGAINVNAYKGSRLDPINMMRPSDVPAPAPAGSATPPPQAMMSMRERTADTLLRSRFGAPPNERGQVDIAGAEGTRSVPARPQDLMRPAPTGPATPPPQAMMTAPGAGLPTPPRNSVYSLTQGTRLDPANIVLQAEERYLKTRAADTANASAVQMMQQSAETHGAGMERHALDMKERTTEFTPTKIMLDGTSVIKNTRGSVMPDHMQVRPATPKEAPASTGDAPILSTDGKWFKSRPEDEWKPAPASQEKPLTVNEWLLAGRPEGNYKTYRDTFQKESAAVAKPAPGAAPAAAPAAGAKAAAPARALYRNEDVQAELKRRGLAK